MNFQEEICSQFKIVSPHWKCRSLPHIIIRIESQNKTNVLINRANKFKLCFYYLSELYKETNKDENKNELIKKVKGFIDSCERDKSEDKKKE